MKGTDGQCCGKRNSLLFCRIFGWSVIVKFLGMWRNLDRRFGSWRGLMQVLELATRPFCNYDIGLVLSIGVFL